MSNNPKNGGVIALLILAQKAVNEWLALM